MKKKNNLKHPVDIQVDINEIKYVKLDFQSNVISTF